MEWLLNLVVVIIAILTALVALSFGKDRCFLDRCEEGEAHVPVMITRSAVCHSQNIRQA